MEHLFDLSATIAVETKKRDAPMLIISDIFWNEIKTIIPQKKSKVGRPPKDAKLVLSGIFYIISSGAQWRLLPDYYRTYA